MQVDETSSLHHWTVWDWTEAFTVPDSFLRKTKATFCNAFTSCSICSVLFRVECSGAVDLSHGVTPTSWGKEQLCCALFSSHQAGAAEQIKEVKSYHMDDGVFEEPAWEHFHTSDRAQG